MLYDIYMNDLIEEFNEKMKIKESIEFIKKNTLR